MFAADQNNPDQRELNPDKLFEGLGLVGWFRLVFQSRARTIKQCDMVVDMLVRKMDAQESELRGLRKAVATIPALVEALEEHHRVSKEYHADVYDESTIKGMTEDALAGVSVAL